MAHGLEARVPFLDLDFNPLTPLIHQGFLQVYTGLLSLFRTHLMKIKSLQSSTQLCRRAC